MQVTLRHVPANKICRRNDRRPDRPDAGQSLALDLHCDGLRVLWQVEHELFIPPWVGAAFSVHVRGAKLVVGVGPNCHGGFFLDGFSI
ncbi:hypothetical protein ACFX11_040808 [Malus domestica]